LSPSLAAAQAPQWLFAVATDSSFAQIFAVWLSPNRREQKVGEKARVDIRQDKRSPRQAAQAPLGGYRVTTGIPALSTAAVAGISSSDIAGLTTTQCNAFTTTQIQSMSPAQVDALLSLFDGP
jgi:hypothetical protein